MRKKLIIDTDLGVDDAVALTFLINKPDQLDIKLITTVIGNIPVETATRNTLHLLEKFNKKDIPVSVGAARPLVKEPINAIEVHSITGMGNYQPSEPKIKPISMNAVEALKKEIDENAGEIEILTLGPLTNLAKLFSAYPEVKTKIKKLYIMAASIWGQGNITPFTEFNAFVDPDALKIVLTAGISTVVSPMEMGHTLVFSHHYVENLRKMNNTGAFFAKMADGYIEPAELGISGFCNHDPALAYFLIYPNLFIQKKMSVKFGSTDGQTFFKEDDNSNLSVLVAADKIGYERIFKEEVKKILI